MSDHFIRFTGGLNPWNKSVKLFFLASRLPSFMGIFFKNSVCKCCWQKFVEYTKLLFQKLKLKFYYSITENGNITPVTSVGTEPLHTCFMSS